MISLLLILFSKIDSTATAAKAAENLSFPELISQTFDKVIGWGKTGFHYLPNFIVAVIILIVFYFIGRLLSKLVGRILKKTTDNHTVIDLIETVVGILMIIVGIFLALAIVNLSGIVTTLLAGAGIIGLALGFAVKGITSNFISGVYISIRQPFKKGDLIESGKYFGTVHKIELRCTLIRTPSGQIVYIPNSGVIGDAFINYTDTHERRVDVECRISYADDLEQAKRVALEAVESLDNYKKDRPVQFLYNEFDDFAISFKVRFWINFTNKNIEYLSFRSEAIMAIYKRFEEEGLNIPYPIRTLDFGNTNGEEFNAIPGRDN